MLCNVLTYRSGFAYLVAAGGHKRVMAQLRITELLDEREHSAYWLAKETSIGYPVLWKLINGKMRALRFDYIDKICAALRCTPGDLIVLSNGKKKGGQKKKSISGKQP